MRWLKKELLKGGDRKYNFSIEIFSKPSDCIVLALK